MGIKGNGNPACLTFACVSSIVDLFVSTRQVSAWSHLHPLLAAALSEYWLRSAMVIHHWPAFVLLVARLGLEPLSKRLSGAFRRQMHGRNRARSCARAPAWVRRGRSRAFRLANEHRHQLGSGIFLRPRSDLPCLGHATRVFGSHELSAFAVAVPRRWGRALRGLGLLRESQKQRCKIGGGLVWCYFPMGREAHDAWVRVEMGPRKPRQAAQLGPHLSPIKMSVYHGKKNDNENKSHVKTHPD